MPAGDAIERTRALLRSRSTAEPTADGYLDLLGPDDPAPRSVAQRAMRSTLLPAIYERAWRPLLFRVWTGRSTDAEERQLQELLGPRPGDALLDVACGPGNTTRRLHAAVGDGLVVGIDASATMLAQAVRDTDADAVAFVRGDAHALPFADASFDGVTCYGALYLMDEPFAAIAEMVRVLAPGGRIAVLTSCHRGPWPLRTFVDATERLSGVHVFGRGEITGAFREHRLVDVRQEVTAWSQVVAARRAT